MFNAKAWMPRFPRGTLGSIARSHAWALPPVALLGALASVLESVGIGLLIPLVGLLLAEAEPAGTPAPIRAVAAASARLDPGDRIVAIGAGMVLLILLKGAVQAGNAVLIAHVEGRLGRDLRDALSKRILGADYCLFLRHDNARLVSVVVNDSWFATEAGRSILSMVSAAAGLAVLGSFLIWLDWRLTLIVGGGAILVLALVALTERKLRAISFEVAASGQAVAKRILAIVGAMRVIRVLGQQDRERSRFAAASERLRASFFTSQRRAAVLGPATDVLIAAVFMTILLSAFWLGTAIPTVMAFLVLLARAQPYLRSFSEGRLGFAKVQGSVKEVEWLLDLPLEPPGRPGTAAPAFDRPISFRGVSYAYPNGNPAIREASFILRPGVATALIGPSGSGKSTLVNLLCRLIEPDRGSIHLGDIRIDEISSADWRGRIAIAGQDFELLDGAVAEAIAYGRPDASRDEIERAAASAGATAFIAALPGGYETRIGDGGHALSGGQRQRLALARALLVQPDLLILDEATNAVDAMSEQEIIRLLADHRHFRSALVISHRKSTLSACQDGIVLDHGVVREAGPLAGLAYYRAMASGGEIGPE